MKNFDPAFYEIINADPVMFRDLILKVFETNVTPGQIFLSDHDKEQIEYLTQLGYPRDLVEKVYI